MIKTDGFIAKHNLWTVDQAKQAAELGKQVDSENLHLIRLVWSDTHGSARAKAVTLPVFKHALSSGYNINVATTTLDASGGRVFTSFKRGGGMELDEMTGSPNLIIVPDPATFRILPWAPGIGWILCDPYFRDATPFHFSSRFILKKQLARLKERGSEKIIGLEVEWYLTKIADAQLGAEHIGEPGRRGQPIATVPVEPGFTYHSETNMDIMQPVISELAHGYEKLNLPLRSIENEWGPGQLECTFSAQSALQAADDYVLFRTATRQICRRLGYLASFMARPAFDGFYASGWHLHQSLVDAKTGKNQFMPGSEGQILSELGLSYLGGLLENAIPATVFATPTINGYGRFKSNSLAPDRVAWGFDHRGVMVRALGGAGDPATRLENRMGEPAANPYLFIAAQIIAGLDGLENARDPGPPEDEPYDAQRPLLPTSLTQALEAFEADNLFRRELGDHFQDYFVKMKRAEIGRYEDYCRNNAVPQGSAAVTQWEQNEYFDFF